MPGADESDCTLMPYNHQEFDTRVMLHATNAVSRGYKRILMIAKGTDVIVLGTSFFNDIGADKLWVSFGIGNKLLCYLMDTHETPSSDDIAVTESFVISLYSVPCA